MSRSTGKCMKFWNPVTGARKKVDINKPIAEHGEDKPRTIVSMEKAVSYMNQQGYVRAGTRQVLNSTEKELLKGAPAAIEKLQEILAVVNKK